MRHRIAKASGPLERKPQTAIARVHTPTTAAPAARGGGVWAGATVNPHKAPRST